MRSFNDHLLHHVKLRTQPTFLAIDNHSEKLIFHVIETPSQPVVLDIPWLQHHNPHIDWCTGKILSWSTTCQATCLHSAPAPLEEDAAPKEHYLDITNVPEVYHDLKEVFNKAKANLLPPYCTYDCAIDLLSGTMLPTGLRFSLSAPEIKSIDNYLTEALEAGIIRPSSLPEVAGFFFVGKKDGGLRPCIDYCGLNQITVKNRYPLPLMTSTFDLLQGSTIYTVNLDLRNVYPLVHIREGDK